MTTLTFTPIDRHGDAVHALAVALAVDYQVDGPATHAARTDIGELAIAFPLPDGWRLLLVVLPDRGDPDETEMDPAEVERADNGDGTFTVGTRMAFV